MLAIRFGAAAIEHLMRGEHGGLVGLNQGEISMTPLDAVVSAKKPLDLNQLALANALAILRNQEEQ